MELDALRGVSVLIVDDSDVNRRVLVEQVTAWGLRAETCAAGVDALRMLREAHTAGCETRASARLVGAPRV